MSNGTAKKNGNGKKPKTIGRPRFPVAWDNLDVLIRCGCTQAEVAAKLNVSEDTISRIIQKDRGKTFAEYSGTKRLALQADLKALLISMAFGNPKNSISPNTTVAIYLSKVLLGYSESQRIVHEGRIDHSLMEKTDEELARIINADVSVDTVSQSVVNG